MLVHSVRGFPLETEFIGKPVSKAGFVEPLDEVIISVLDGNQILAVATNGASLILKPQLDAGEILRAPASSENVNPFQKEGKDGGIIQEDGIVNIGGVKIPVKQAKTASSC